MDVEGIDPEVLFPPQRMIGPWLGHEDDDVVRAGVVASNELLWDESTAPDRSRLIPLAQISNLGIDAAVAVVQGRRRPWFQGRHRQQLASLRRRSQQGRRSFRAAAAETGLTVCYHVHITSRSQRIVARKASGGRVLGRGTGRDAKEKAVGGLGLPHRGNDRPYSRKTIDEMTFDVPDDDEYELIAGNAVRVLNLEQ